ncbi:unnamed protein product [Rhodiola kirilowii]
MPPCPAAFHTPPLLAPPSRRLSSMPPPHPAALAPPWVACHVSSLPPQITPPLAYK